ncbi:MAG TPA: GAF domain-containing protein, partial [Pyrinomonadaceae bacterium]|nr:GAF domain-containing protein [Pyrinomonadaceae bacterium]
MAIKVSIVCKRYDPQHKRKEDPDHMSSTGRLLSLRKEPTHGFARNHVVKYSLGPASNPSACVEFRDRRESPSGIRGEKEVNAYGAQAINGDLLTQKYLTLLELSKAIASHRDLSELFHDLFCRLQNLFPFRDLAVMLHDERHGVMRSYILEGCDIPASIRKDPTEVPVEGSINGHVWQEQEAIIIADLDRDFQFPSAQILRDKGIKSVCCLPLSTVHQRLGTLNLWSGEIGAYEKFDISFAQLVASQIAVAVEAQFHREQLAHERDRSRLLLEVNNTLVSNLNLRELLSAISVALSPVMPHEAAALTLYDESLNQLRVAALDAPEHIGPCDAGDIIPLEGSPIGEAFTTRKTVLIDYGQSNEGKASCSALVSGCASPLIFRDRVLGVLGIKSSREHAFSQEDAELFEQVANQVAIAVENALAYNEIETLKNKLEKE